MLKLLQLSPSRNGAARIRRFLSLALTGVLTYSLVVATPQLAAANVGGGVTYVLGVDGFDTAAQNSLTPGIMQWIAANEANVSDFYVYIGGENATVSTLGSPGGASWIDQVAQQGWHFLPTYVGLQAPCTPRPYATISTDATTATLQGFSDAATAQSEVDNNFGFGYGTTIALDIEGYGNSSCLWAAAAAVNNYVNGWDYYLLSQYGTVSTVYGSSCDSYVSNWASLANVPQQVWLAASNSDTVWNYPCVSNNLWSGYQRHGQYTDAYFGYFHVDRDAAWGVAAP